ncbi:uncharacterized protein [Drosophila pseudoobscura]|uniref:Transmembrane protein 72 n=1 Tax=Drosophila pseudoobscura pseudoobscura TaxID=46245 RepID=A0A6I8UBM1_DROPS|nr:uncharacterized protein LOC4812340 [Drosophila pseudoobscura]
MSQIQLQQQQQQLHRRGHRHHRRRQPPEPCECLRPVIRVFGLLTSFVICGVGVDVYMHGFQAGLYILFSALLVMFIEIKWLFTLFLQLQCSEDNYQRGSRGSYSCLGCWRVSSAFCGGWHPTPIYAIIGICLILYPHNLWLSYVAGMFLLLLGLLRLCTLMRFIPAKDEGLLPQCDFEKVSSFVDNMEDDFVEISASQTVLDQEDDDDDGDEEPTIDDDVC